MKRFLFVLCVLGLLLAGYACAEPNSYKFPEELCTVEGISFRITYSKTDHEWQASITDADPGCVSTAVPFEVGCTADWVEYNDGTEEAPVYRTVNNVYVTATVRSIDSKAFQGCTSLTKIAIPDTVKTIGMNAFDGCTSLKSVNFGTGLNTIEAGAFSGCPLTEIVVPDNVTTIGGGAFGGTTPVNVTLPFTGVSLTNPYIYNKEFKYIFSGENSQRGDIPDTIRTVTITQQTEYTDRVFADCSRITAIHIPDGTTGIAAEAFDGCTSLTDFQLPAALESIENYAFNGCAALGSVCYGGSPCMRELVSIGDRNEPLTNAAWTYALTKELILPQNVQLLESEALAGTGAEVVLIPQSCSSVAADAFDNCPGLRYIVNRSAVEINAPDGVTVLN